MYYAVLFPSYEGIYIATNIFCFFYYKESSNYYTTLSFHIFLSIILLFISNYIYYLFYISVCLEADSVPPRRGSPGITSCLARECLQASARVKRLILFFLSSNHRVNI